MKKKDSAVRWGLALFLTVGAILLFYDTLFGRRVLPSFGGQLLKALQPVLIGAVLAYLLAPVIDFIENLFFPEQMKKAHAEGRMTSRSARAVSLVVTWAIIGLLCYLLGHVLIPQLYRSVVQLVSSVEGYYNTISGWVEHLLESNPTVEVWVAGQMDKFYESATEWLKNQVFTRTQMLMIAVSGGVLSTLAFLKNLLVGMIVSVYFMATKERCAAHARKLAYSLFSEEAVYWVFRGSAKVDRIFSGFVRGKLLDSLIIGVLCFIGCSLLDMPYTPLVSVFVGVTNVIPFFGPFLGAIPSFFLILLVDPIQSLYFLLFVLALQQLDGNVWRVCFSACRYAPACTAWWRSWWIGVWRKRISPWKRSITPLRCRSRKPSLKNRRKRRKTCKKGLQSAAVSCTIQPCGHIVRKITNDVSQGCFCGLATAYSLMDFQYP